MRAAKATGEAAPREAGAEYMPTSVLVHNLKAVSGHCQLGQPYQANLSRQRPLMQIHVCTQPTT